MPGQGQGPPPSPIQIGDLVGFAEGKGESSAPGLAVVSRIQGSRADVKLSPPSRTLQLPLRQLSRIATAPGPLEAPLPTDPSQPPWNLNARDLAAARPRPRDLGAAWQVLVTESQAGEEQPRGEGSPELSLEAFTELVSGHPDPLHCSACWLWLHGTQTLFRLRQEGIRARSLPELRQLRRDRRLQKLAEDRQAHWVRALRERQPISADQLAEPQIRELEELRQLAAGVGGGPPGETIRPLLQQVRCSGAAGDVRHLLADVGLWPRHHLPSLEGTSWQQGFSGDLRAEAERLLELADGCLPGDGNRLDLGHLHTVTIDDEDTTDIDDALSIEWTGEGTPWIWIHVADPGRLIPPESPLDLEARRRATSLYLAEGILPMFPESLSTGPLSLRAGRRSAAWSLRIRLAADGSVAARELHRSWIRPTYRLSYGDADEILELAPPQERELLTLQELMGRRRRWRAGRGALFLEQAEGRIRRRTAHEEGAVLEITEPTASRQLVAEAMILAGAAVADFGREQGIPLPYRSQPVAPLPREEELAGLPAGPARLAAMKKGLTRGVVGTTPLPHFSLGLEAYVQATSPIRRYGDLVVQRQLAAHLDGQAPMEAMALSDLLSSLEGGLREGIAITREDQRHWQQVWFSEQKGQQWRGTFLRWLREDHHLALIHLETLAMDLPAECHGSAQPGDGVLVRVREVDPLRDLLRLDARSL